METPVYGGSHRKHRVPQREFAKQVLNSFLESLQTSTDCDHSFTNDAPFDILHLSKSSAKANLWKVFQTLIRNKSLFAKTEPNAYQACSALEQHSSWHQCLQHIDKEHQCCKSVLHIHVQCKAVHLVCLYCMLPQKKRQ